MENLVDEKKGWSIKKKTLFGSGNHLPPFVLHLERLDRNYVYAKKMHAQF